MRAGETFRQQIWIQQELRLKMTSELQRKTVPGHLIKGSPEGQIEAIVSVFGNVDSYGERCVLGCFANSIAKKLPKGVWMHDWANPVSKTLEAKELAPGESQLPEHLKALGGLYIKGQFFKDIDDSWQAYLKIREELVDEYSIGYRNIKRAKNEETNIVDLLELDLFEWSPVLVGGNRATATLSVKTDLMDGPRYGMSIEEHTEILLKRIEKRFQDRESEDTLTDGFVNRLRETGDKIVALADSAKARDAAAPEVQATTIGDLDWEASKHAMRMRAIRSKAS